MQAYLFVHFRDKTTPDGEQMYFGISQDGFRWEAVNGGNPVCWAYYGEKGVRDFTIIRNHKNRKFYIFATDLSLSYGMRNQYHHSWEEISKKGSKYFSMWESENLVDWTEQRLLKIGDEDFGCLWAPDIIYDRKRDDYVIHWTSSHRNSQYQKKGIYYSRTADFQHFTEPRLLYEGEDSVIDSAVYEEGDRYYLFVKNEGKKAKIEMMQSEELTGPYSLVEEFDKSMEPLEPAMYEAPTAVKLEDGRWALFLDYYGKVEKRQGYMPFLADNLASGKFTRSDERFKFPYGFKHGTILPITQEEYNRIREYRWWNSVCRNSVCRMVVDIGKKGFWKGDLFGIFFEDLNHAADGGLYAEMIQNRDFEFSSEDNEAYTSFTAWETTGESSSVNAEVMEQGGFSKRNPHYLRLETHREGCGIRNLGYHPGIPYEKGKRYQFSCYAKKEGAKKTNLRIILNGKNGEIYGEDFLEVDGEWKKYELILESDHTDYGGSLSIILVKAGTVYLDFVSLFPVDTYKKRRNGMRSDLAQALADLRPRFLRFPGGCLVHCGTPDAQDRHSMYRWKCTLGEVVERPSKSSTWNYHQTLGLGYYEYFLLCEDIGAKPIPVIPAGFNPHTQSGAPLDEMQEWIDEALDLIEFANGSKESKWGAVRVEMGHPEPFHMEYLGIGNEEQGDGFFERYSVIHKAVRERYPDVKLINSAGPFCAGGDFEKGWDFARKEKSDIVDEHYYQAPEWFIANHHRYDTYETEPKVFLGEYASKGNEWYNALAEASYMIGLERNADKVALACYAPLFCHVDYVNWGEANLIWFDNHRMVRTPSYYVQKLFMNHQGDWTLPCKMYTLIPAEEWQKGDGAIIGNVVFGSNNAEVIYSEIRIEDERGKILFSEDAHRICPGEALDIGRIERKDYTISFQARQVSEAGEGFLVEFGKQDMGNKFQLCLGGWNRANNTLEEWINQKISCLSQYPFLLKVNQIYNVKISVLGKRIVIYIDGEEYQRAERISVIAEPLYYSASMDEESGDIIVKIVNVTDSAKKLELFLNGEMMKWECKEYYMRGYDKHEKNTLEQTEKVKPVVFSYVNENNRFDFEVPKESFAVYRMSKIK